MRYLRCSYPELLLMPDDYVPVILEMAKEEAHQRR